MFVNPLFWLFALPGLLLGLYAQARIKSNFATYSQVRTPGDLTGAQVARALLDSQGLQDITIEPTAGALTDHYDPGNKVLRLSQAVYHTPSVAAAGVAAHEAGHAMQDAVGYLPLKMRSAIVPVVQFGSNLAPWLFLAGFLLGILELAWAGVILFGLSTIFTLITLPVEFDASNRAKQLLVNQGILGRTEETEGVKKVLGAAAWTYVAAAVSSIGNLLYYIFLLSGSRRRRYV
ncbi:MAG: zinc metallopeptidase [Anaerolineae bacterium]|nr:zinc metallopeptidase [Anaerolineae bacterium]